MKNKLFILFLLFVEAGAFAQGIFNNGGKIVIGSGAVVYIAGTSGNFRNETNGSDGSIALDGTIKLQGNYINNVLSADILTTIGTSGEVDFIGSVPQLIGGSTTTTFVFNNITVNNSSGLTLSQNVNIHGVLNLSSGLINIGVHNVTLGPAATITGTPSSTNMFIATGTGEVRKEFTGIGTFTFPVGSNDISAIYSPVFINFTAGTFGSGAYSGVNLVNAKYPDPNITGSYLKRYWNITTSGITAYNSNLTFQYDISDVVGTEGDLSCLKVNPLPFALFDPANTVLHHLTANGITSPGTFTGALGNKTLNLTLFLESLYNGAGLMRQAQGLTGNQFPGTTADQISIELHDAVVYSNLIYTINNVNLSTTGLASVQIPSTYNSSYYITIKNRNSIATVTSSPVALSSTTTIYEFVSVPGQAFGNNLKYMEPGTHAIYGGDANGDGAVDALDLIAVQNDVLLFSGGYLVTDLNGDGVVDALDLILATNNALLFISTINP